MLDIRSMKLWLQVKLNKFMREEKGEVNIVAIVILIGIAVVLALVFKDAISGLLKKMLGQIETNALDAIETEAP